MIKPELLGQIENSKNRADITSNAAVKNYSFLTYEGNTYLIDQAASGDDAHKEGLEFPANTKLRGFDISAWIGQKIIVDGKHIVGGVSGCHVLNGTEIISAEKTASTAGSLSSITNAAGTISDVVVKNEDGENVAGTFSSGTFTATTSSDIASGSEYTVTYKVTYSASTILNIDASTGKLTSGSASGFYFTYLGSTTLTERAAILKIAKA